MEETIVQELREQRLDLLARAKFSEPKTPIHESRAVMEDMLYEEEKREEKAATNLIVMGDDVEWGE